MRNSVGAKSLKRFGCLLLVALFMQPLCAAATQPRPSDNPVLDSVEISLLTCAPHDEVYSLYGHTAIRIQNKVQGSDLVVNYGMFSFQKPFFVLRFVFGLTDYEMGIEPFENFAAQYAFYGSRVIQQTLNLTPEDKAAILAAIEENSRPENIVYRYNFFYDNCTTRARDILTRHIAEKVRYAPCKEGETTYRKLVHGCTENQLWTRFGNDLLLGFLADCKLNRRQEQFLPDNLRHDFDKAVVVDAQGKTRPWVQSTSIAVAAEAVPAVPSSFPRPRVVLALLFALTLFITGVERKTRRRQWGFDALLLLVSGLAGVILLAMAFSEHPTVNFNFQILVLNPASLFLCYHTVKMRKKQPSKRYWQALGVCTLLFFAGGFIQCYAEGMYFLALSLLIRCAVNQLSMNCKAANE